MAHPRGLAGALPAVAVPLAVALNRAYGADLLARYDYAGADARAQGRSLLVVVIACMVAAGVLRWLALRIDRRVERVRMGARTRTIVFSGAGIAVLLVLAVATAAFDLPDRFAEQRRAFVRGNAPPGGADLRTRLTSVGNNGRLYLWRVAHGRGARRTRGTAAARARSGSRGSACGPRRPPHVVDGHSLYYEVRGELGWIGIGLLLVAFAVPFGVAIGRLWGPGRHVHAAFLAAGGALLLHAMVDWDWEMPALFLWFFGAAGAVIAAPAAAAERCAPAAAADAPARRPRVPAAGGDAADRRVLAVAAQRGAAARCGAATARRRRTPRSAASTRCRARRARSRSSAGATLRAGQSRLALAAMRNAQRRDPDNWQYAYGLAVAQALAGQDPRPAAAKALRLNPLEPMTSELAAAVNSRSAATSPRGRGEARRSRSINDERRAGARLSEVVRCARRLALVAGATAEHEARAQQRDAAEQDRDGREAGERELAVVGARLDLPRGLDARLPASAGAAVVLRRRVAGAGVLVAEDAAAARGRRRRCRVLRDAGVVAGQAGDRRDRRRRCSAACRARAWSG